MLEPITDLAKRYGIARGSVAATLGISERQLTCLNRGHAWLSEDGLRAAAQRLGGHCTMADVRRALLFASLTPFPRSNEMEDRRSAFEHAVGCLPEPDAQAIDWLANEHFPDELERDQVAGHSMPVRWKPAYVAIPPAERTMGS